MLMVPLLRSIDAPFALTRAWNRSKLCYSRLTFSFFNQFLVVLLALLIEDAVLKLTEQKDKKDEEAD